MNNIENLVLVRATEVLPINGVVQSINNTQYVKKNISSFSTSLIKQLLDENNVLPVYNFQDDYDDFVKENSRIIREYLPYVSDYSSVIFFSLNGLCPDDSTNGFGNNTFSNKKIVIFEPLKYHVNEVISLHPTDTTIKNDVVLSSDALILIELSYYDSLSDKEKELIKSNNVNLRFFSGDVQDAVNDVLDDSVYSKENLSLSTSVNNVYDSPTKEIFLKNIEQTRIDYGLSHYNHTDILLHSNVLEDLPEAKIPLLKEEVDKALFVMDYYDRKFILALIEDLGLEESYKEKVDLILTYSNYKKEFIDLIANMGLLRYKKFLEKYNGEIEDDIKNNRLKTPEEIITNSGKFNLTNIMER